MLLFLLTVYMPTFTEDAVSVDYSTMRTSTEDAAVSVDVHAAGEGQLQIMVNNGNIPNEVEAQDVGVYLIQFIPLEVGVQQVDILFNDEALPGGYTVVHCHHLHHHHHHHHHHCHHC